ncbi:unnamed protein product, partial [Ectocarpus sp. 8 AP-2014]
CGVGDCHDVQQYKTSFTSRILVFVEGHAQKQSIPCDTFRRLLSCLRSL